MENAKKIDFFDGRDPMLCAMDELILEEQLALQKNDVRKSSFLAGVIFARLSIEAAGVEL